MYDECINKEPYFIYSSELCWEHIFGIKNKKFFDSRRNSDVGLDDKQLNFLWGLISAANMEMSFVECSEKYVALSTSVI